MKYLFLWVIACLLLTGCVATQSIYFWGDYSQTAYDYQKAPSAETLAAHKRTLERIIEHSKVQEVRIAPGLAYELAMIELEQGNASRGRQLLLLELASYPESGVMVNRVLTSLED